MPAQGHPKLLELAEGLAADRKALAKRVRAAEKEVEGHGEVLDAFFAAGIAKEGETRRSDADFVRALRGWTSGMVADSAPTARLLFQVLCGLEPEDRRRGILDATWKNMLTPAWATANRRREPPWRSRQRRCRRRSTPWNARGSSASNGRPRSIRNNDCRFGAFLAQQPSPLSLHTTMDQFRTVYTVHPGVAEAARAAAEPAVLAAAEVELGNWFIAGFQRGLKTEQEGGGGTVVDAARRAAPYLLRRERWKEASTLLQVMLIRDISPESLAYALPLVRRGADALRGTEWELMGAVLLAQTLQQAGRAEEAEPLYRDLMARAADWGDYRTARNAAGGLVTLLWESGRLSEALALNGETAAYTRRAGLGPWSQLADEGTRLRVLAQMGRYDEVLKAVEALRPRMATLPEQGEAEENAEPWNVRETLLDTGKTAATYGGRHEQALTLNAEVVESKKKRGAGALELARAQFNDYGSLLRLKRYEEARRLLEGCRSVFETERDFTSGGKVWAARADLADKTGGRADAVRFSEIALGYVYPAGQPEDCASCHHNLALHLERQGIDPTTVLAHHLAARVIRYQTQSVGFAGTLRNLAGSELPPQLPTFDAVAARVEEIEGVAFRALFERLPAAAPDGDAAIAAVWQRVAEERQRQAAVRGRRQTVLAKMPPTIRAAFDLEGKPSLRPCARRSPHCLRKKPTRGSGSCKKPVSSLAARSRTWVRCCKASNRLLQAIAGSQGDEAQRAGVEQHWRI